MQGPSCLGIAGALSRATSTRVHQITDSTLLGISRFEAPPLARAYCPFTVHF